MQEPLEMYTASRMQNMAQIRKKNACVVMTRFVYHVAHDSHAVACPSFPCLTAAAATSALRREGVVVTMRTPCFSPFGREAFGKGCEINRQRIQNKTTYTKSSINQ